MNKSRSEAEVLEGLLADLVAQGYDVYPHPRGSIIPAFLGEHSPDAIAIRGDKKLAIVVLRSNPKSIKKSEQLRRLFEGHDDWEFRVIWAAPIAGRTLQTQSRSVIDRRIAEVEELAQADHIGPALLVAWATLEAIGRRLLPSEFERPQTPGRLVEVLASQGEVDPTQADILRRLSKKRNEFIHGELQTRVEKDQVTKFAGILRTLAGSEQRKAS